MFSRKRSIQERLKKLEQHLQRENELLVDVVQCFRVLDKVAYRTGLQHRDQSLATQISWWPLISLLGTFSAGKSTFVNNYIQFPLQETGTQAVDDKFTVICFSSDGTHRVLPGISLDADPRFPFYQMADELEKVSPGEGGRVNSYLQMKTCPSEHVKGNIIIDSPGFDADEQRNATLRITDYIIDLSDLVLVFFDARHPEPGAMQDTLRHLVSNQLSRNDASKFIYVLNQIDTTAREDNAEDVVAAWQRALAKGGLTAGEFYCIYNPDAAMTIEDPSLRARYETKRDADLDAIHQRIKQVGVERIYRVIGALEKTAKEFEESRIPELRRLLSMWKQGVVWREGIAVVVLAIAVLVGMSFDQSGTVMRGWFETVTSWWNLDLSLWGKIGTVGLGLALIYTFHLLIRKSVAKSVIKRIDRDYEQEQERVGLKSAFVKNTAAIHSLFRPEPVGWGAGAQRRIRSIVDSADGFVQKLNDKYTLPSGNGGNDEFINPRIADDEEETEPDIVEARKAIIES